MGQKNAERENRIWASDLAALERRILSLVSTDLDHIADPTKRQTHPAWLSSHSFPPPKGYEETKE